MAPVISEFAHQYFHINHVGLVSCMHYTEGAQNTFNSVPFQFIYDSLTYVSGEKQWEVVEDVFLKVHCVTFFV